MTLLTVSNGDGERRCDARCHHVKQPKCDCCCEGRFHGKGSGSGALQSALDTVTGDWLEHLRAAGVDIRPPEEFLGRPLFTQDRRRE